MDTQKHCPSCQKPLAPDVPLGLCPECLVKAGFPSAADTKSVSAAAFVPPSVAELAPLFPQLEILELIGKGGMGAMYKARQKQLNRLVSLAGFSGLFSPNGESRCVLKRGPLHPCNPHHIFERRYENHNRY
jgi:hypothetical protein